MLPTHTTANLNRSQQAVSVPLTDGIEFEKNQGSLLNCQASNLIVQLLHRSEQFYAVPTGNEFTASQGPVAEQTAPATHDTDHRRRKLPELWLCR